MGAPGGQEGAGGASGALRGEHHLVSGWWFNTAGEKSPRPGERSDLEGGNAKNERAQTL